MKVRDLITLIRGELTDEKSTRWTDASLLQLTGRTIRRTMHILRKNEIEFAKSYEDYVTQAGVDTYSLPMDFLAPVALYNTDDKYELTHRIVQQWEILDVQGSVSNWIILGDDFKVKDVPSEAVNLRLYYWPDIDTANLNLDSYMPWDGKLDDLIIEYCALRAKNIDEMNTQADLQLLQDFENNVLDTFATINPSVIPTRGWMV